MQRLASQTATETPEAGTEEYTLPCVEALLAGCFALMTGYAQSAPDCPHRPLLAAKLISNLIRLSHDSALTPQMRSMLDNLRTRWQLEIEGQLARREAPQPTPLWCATPSAMQ
jgi:hypothetical protein